MNFFKRIARLWKLAATYDEQRRLDRQHVFGRLQEVDAKLGLLTTVHVDVNWQQPHQHQVIAIGKYRGHDYVHVYDLQADSWNSLIEMLQELEKGANVGRFDIPSHAIPVNAVYPRKNF